MLNNILKQPNNTTIKGKNMIGKSNNTTIKGENNMIEQSNDTTIKGVNNMTEQRNEVLSELSLKNEYVKEYCVESYLDTFTQNMFSNTKYIKTGFNTLDYYLGGGISTGLYILGAISSLGKTTFCTQIADQIAYSGEDVLIFSLEQSRFELMSKSISRNTVIISEKNKLENRYYARTSKEITNQSNYENYSDIQKIIINDAQTEYKKIAKHIFISEGVGNIGLKQIREAVEKHICYTGKKPIVLIDYLQIISPHNERASDKQIIDKNVSELKRLSRDFKLPIIAISSLNRQSYNSRISMESFKESGGVEYSSDVLIGLQLKGVGTKSFDVNEAKKKLPREVELVILKNRNGRSGDVIDYKYHSQYNYFKEETDYVESITNKMKEDKEQEKLFKQLYKQVNTKYFE